MLFSLPQWYDDAVHHQGYCQSTDSKPCGYEGHLGVKGRARGAGRGKETRGAGRRKEEKGGVGRWVEQGGGGREREGQGRCRKRKGYVRGRKEKGGEGK